MHLPRRFDELLMLAPALAAPGEAALLPALRAWCEAGAFPHMTVPLAAASMAPQAGLDAAACAMDGSDALARMPRWQGLAWRLQILLREQRPGHRARTGDPWDCGWWREGPLSVAAAFRPRRPTLLLVRESGARHAASLLDELRAHSLDYAWPLRVLLLSALPVPGLPRLKP